MTILLTFPNRCVFSVVDQEGLTDTVGFETVMAYCVNSGFLGDSGPSSYDFITIFSCVE